MSECTMSPQGEMPAVFQMESCRDHDMFEISVNALQHLFSTGALSSLEYVTYCLERIRKINPYLECVLEINPDALELATVLDEERRNGKVRGPLHGVPVLVKDNMATADRMQTTAGSWALLGSIVPEDATIVHKLRNAGAILLGKANMDEWAGMRCSAYSTGYSARGGQCRNPYILSRSPNGSSSGSAVSVSANIVPMAFGTETDCSIISPAAVSGVVGIKPTVGLTSRSGVIPISETQDSVGPYGRTVADAARALDVIAAEDPQDEFTMQPERRQPKSYCDFLTNRYALKGARFGLPIKRFWEAAPAPQRTVAEAVLKLMKDAGAQIIDVDMPCAEERMQPDGKWDWQLYGETNPKVSEITVSKVQTYYLMNRYLSKLQNTAMKTLEDIVQYNDDNRGTEGGHAGDLPAWPDGQKLFRECVETKGVKDDTYHAALKHIQTQCRQNGIDAALHYTSTETGPDGVSVTKDHQLDALLFCDVKAGGIQIAAQAGYPIISIPIGLDPDGMPVPLTLQHTAWQEDRLVKWASAIEDLLQANSGQKAETAATMGRVPPLYKRHLSKNIPLDPEYRY